MEETLILKCKLASPIIILSPLTLSINHTLMGAFLIWHPTSGMALALCNYNKTSYEASDREQVGSNPEPMLRQNQSLNKKLIQEHHPSKGREMLQWYSLALVFDMAAVTNLCCLGLDLTMTMPAQFNHATKATNFK